MHSLTRRAFVRSIGGLCLLTHAEFLKAENLPERLEVAPTLASIIRHPLLVSSLYRLPVSHDYSADGAAGANRGGYRWIEEQRQGAEWIVRGTACRQPNWNEIGWKQLDWGLRHQHRDGSFHSEDPFHSTSFFVEALARSCMLDPEAATAARVEGLARAASWLMRPDIEGPGRAHNTPYTHRRYILAAAFGETGRVTGRQEFIQHAEAWAADGLSLQRKDGVNPERGGFDAGYQMVGVLFSLRYLPNCPNAELQRRLRKMVEHAVEQELEHQRGDGSIDPAGSTRIEIEKSRIGKTKDVPYGEIMQALVYGSILLPKPAWLEPARAIAIDRHWLKP
ncbi:MAG TPA: hypothetical protein VIM69_03310 [Opitutaceae bacterium]